MNPPIIPGYFPDPSVCRVGERYYLANSSFEYFPGVPLHTSTDLLTWEHVTNVLGRPSQLTVRTGIGGASGGIYAPTLRHHAGRFWMTTTNIHEVARGHLIVNAPDPAGPWSDPVYTTGAIGIDPDLVWDESGTCYLTWSDVVNGGIAQAVVDPKTGELRSTPKPIWTGTGGAHAEGPHIYRRGDFWYLLVAEGGTGHGHMVTIARSATVDGPYEANPANPILTHRSTSAPVQATGHADLVELTAGAWAMVHLGTRPRGSFPRWHTNGRETFLVGIDWVDGWPVVDESRYAAPASPRSFTDEFTGGALHPRWIAPGADPATFAQPGPGGLRLTAGRAPGGGEAARLLCTRVTDLEWSASVEADGDLALTLRIDDAHQVGVERTGRTLSVHATIGPLAQVLATDAGVPPGAQPTIRCQAPDARPGQPQGPDVIRLGYCDADGFTELATVDGRYLSTEVAGGFTGRVVGLEALTGDALVHRFHYTGHRA